MRFPHKLIMLLFDWSVAIPSLAAGTDPRRFLSGPEILTSLTGNLISYLPAGSADAGIHEEFHDGGVWRGIYYSRGPINFTGHWVTRNDQLCVSPDKGTIVALWFTGNRCRSIWRDRKTGQLYLEHLNPHFHGDGPLPLTVKNLKTLIDVR